MPQDVVECCNSAICQLCKHKERDIAHHWQQNLPPNRWCCFWQLCHWVSLFPWSRDVASDTAYLGLQKALRTHLCLDQLTHAGLETQPPMLKHCWRKSHSHVRKAALYSRVPPKSSMLGSKLCISGQSSLPLSTVALTFNLPLKPSLSPTLWVAKCPGLPRTEGVPGQDVGLSGQNPNDSPTSAFLISWHHYSGLIKGKLRLSGTNCL